MTSKSQRARKATNAEPDVNAPTDESEVPRNLSTTASFRSTAPSLALADGHMGMRVTSGLIVDDIAMNRDVAGAILQTAGNDVICVSGGAAAAGLSDRDVEAVTAVRHAVEQMDGAGWIGVASQSYPPELPGWVIFYPRGRSTTPDTPARQELRR